MLRPMTDLTRRHLIYGSAASLAALGLAGCVSTDPNSQPAASVPQQPQDLSPPADQAMSENTPVGPLPDARYEAIYGPVTGDRFPDSGASNSR